MHPRPACLLSVGLTLVAVFAGVTAAAEPRPDADRAPVSAATPAAVSALDVLRRWDERRSRAWADGDAVALRRLYTPGSRTGRRDAAALAAYVDRGLRVTSVGMQLLAVGLTSWEEDVLVLVVTDRMTRAVARGGGRRVVLPRDEPSSWRMTLSRMSGDWRMVEVRRAPSPAPP